MKGKQHYMRIWKRVEAETDICGFLYLVPNHALLTLLVRLFRDCSRQVHFELRDEFVADDLSLSVRNNHAPVSTTFRAVLMASCTSHPHSHGSTTTQPTLFTH